jgi:putative transposase
MPDERAATRFLSKAIRCHGVPETMTIDGRAANKAAIESDNAEHGTTIAIRQTTYLHHIVEQDPRAVKRVIRPILRCKSFHAARRTLVGIALMPMIKKRQLVVEEGDESRTADELFSSLAASSPHGRGPLLLQHLLSKICDRIPADALVVAPGRLAYRAVTRMGRKPAASATGKVTGPAG